MYNNTELFWDIMCMYIIHAYIIKEVCYKDLSNFIKEEEPVKHEDMNMWPKTGITQLLVCHGNNLTDFHSGVGCMSVFIYIGSDQVRMFFYFCQITDQIQV